MRTLSPVPYGALFFAPMEGITDEDFRKTIQKLYPEWDYLATDFLRVPSAGRYPLKYLVKHFGKDLFEIPWIQEKTQFQILTSHRAFTQEMVGQVQHLDVPWLDINLGCPSGTVTKNGGGSSLLKDLTALRPLIRSIRETFKGRLSAKVRTGFHNTLEFEDSIRLLNDEGIELITVHGRTRDMMYKEPAQWEYIARAAQISKVPIVGNGDVWETNDINRMLKETGCHAVMVARGALKSPWIAKDYRQGRFTETPAERVKKILEFFNEYRTALESDNITARGLLKQSKSVSRFMMEGLPESDVLRRRLTMSQTVPEFYDHLDDLVRLF